MDISNTEAQTLLRMPKVFAPGNDIIEFSNSTHFSTSYELNAVETKDKFILDVERGDKKRARLRFQSRAKTIIVLARIDINGRAHRNPPSAPHRPGERFTETHIHLYSEEYGDKVAYLPTDIPDFQTPADQQDSSWLISFLKFCKVVQIPTIQETT